MEWYILPPTTHVDMCSSKYKHWLASRPLPIPDYTVRPDGLAYHMYEQNEVAMPQSLVRILPYSVILTFFQHSWYSFTVSHNSKVLANCTVYFCVLV